ncbi:helix-turn-helix domain-containing protein [Alkaliphilus transvaalensis]|uniref:helix-turn-helix domain-containing protein n=1 Tax=Alkaliphilus transvaalensis TaxID=114628 RepID=UPI0004796BB1|nr:helix-turn-helix transcriptional regulator [Alkaliphilus transvaalensis]
MLASRLKLLRKGKGISQKVLAASMELSTSTIAMYETSQRDPDTTTLQKLADFFNVSVDYLLGRTDVKYSYGNEDPMCVFNEESSEYKSPQQRANVIKKVELFNRILEGMIDDGTLKEGFKFDEKTEALILERIEKIIKIYKIMYED